MYNSKRANAKEFTLEDILRRVSEYDIYAHYLGKFKIGMIYNSPFRKDKNPSFGVFVSRKSGKLLFKDHGTNITGDIIKFVQEYTGLTSYNDILNKISIDLNVDNKNIRKSTRVYKIPDQTVIGVVRQLFTEIDKNYWKQFGITLNTLKKFNVSSIKYYLCNGIVKGIYKNDNPMYAYKVFDKFKIYRPLADKYTKWRNNLGEFDIQGYEQLPEKGNLLIITKSLKDVMAYYEMGYTAISPSSESTCIPDKALKALKRRFKTLLLNYDRDIPGAKNMRSISLKTGLNGFFVHKKFNAKDISDAIAQNSQKQVKDWLNKTLKKYEDTP